MSIFTKIKGLFTKESEAVKPQATPVKAAASSSKKSENIIEIKGITKQQNDYSPVRSTLLPRLLSLLTSNISPKHPIDRDADKET